MTSPKISCKSARNSKKKKKHITDATEPDTSARFALVEDMNFLIVNLQFESLIPGPLRAFTLVVIFRILPRIRPCVWI